MPCRDFSYSAGIIDNAVLYSKFKSVINGEHPYKMDEGIVHTKKKFLDNVMGLNAFVAFSMVLGMGVSWQTAMGAVFVSGIIFMLISLPKINLREKIVKAIPKTLRLGVSAGIGLFLAFIGLVDAGIVVDNPATLVGFSGFSANLVLFVFGLILTGALLVKKVKGSLVIGIASVSVLAVVFSVLGFGEIVKLPTSVFALPSLEAFAKLDILGVFKIGMLAPLFTLVFTDMFDSISTFVGVSEVGGMIDKNGEPKNVGKALLVDAFSTTLSGFVGTSSGTTYIESAAGVEEGGRTGLTAVVTGLCFLPFMFLSPLLSFVPMVATGPILFIVGLFMMLALTKLNWKDYENSIPAFLAMLSIPLTYSITTGILLGFLSYIAIKVVLKKYKEIPTTLWAIGGFSLFSLLLTII